MGVTLSGAKDPSERFFAAPRLRMTGQQAPKRYDQRGFGMICLHLSSLTKGSSYSCFWAWARLVENAFHPQADQPFGTFWIRQDIKPSVFDGLDYDGANLLRFHTHLLDARVEILSSR